MHVDFEIYGRFEVPDGTCPVPDRSNLFQLPSGHVISVHPVIEMATDASADDHRDLIYREATEIGVQLDLYDRGSTLT